MSTTTAPGAIAVVGRATPMVLSVARRLRQALGRGVSFTPVDQPRTAHLVSATDAQHAYLTIEGTSVSVAADGSDDADLTARVSWPDPVPSAWEGAHEGTFGAEIRQLLTGPDLDWQSAAKIFWELTSDLPGMPDSLGIYCFDEDATADFGMAGGKHYQILGTSAALHRLLGGSSLLTEELERGELAIDGAPSEFSVLMGANLKVVCGEL